MNPEQNQGDARESNASRPNAGYKLSGEGGPDSPDSSELVFYYNREKRLEKAPQPVRDLYTVQKNKKGFNLLGSLMGSKPTNVMLFFTILVLSASLIILTMTGNLDKSYTLGGNQLSISAVRYEGISIVTLKKTLPKGKKGNTQAYGGPVDLVIAPAVQTAGEDYPEFRHRVSFSRQQEEEYRFAVPFDPPELVLVFQTESSTLKVKIKTE